MCALYFFFCFASIRRHTRCALVTGVQTCALPISTDSEGRPWTPTSLRTLQDWVVRPQLRHVDGVTEVNTVGGYTRQFHITPDPAKLVAYGLSLRDLVDA